jgi:hypothetical protein
MGETLWIFYKCPLLFAVPHEINFGVLLGYAAHHQPTGVDKSLLVAPPPSTRRLQSSRHVTTPNLTIFCTLEISVQYAGPVGIGDRCIRGDKPLAGPERKGLLPSCTNKVCATSFLIYIMYIPFSFDLTAMVERQAHVVQACHAVRPPYELYIKNEL